MRKLHQGLYVAIHFWLEFRLWCKLEDLLWFYNENEGEKFWFIEKQVWRNAPITSIVNVNLQFLSVLSRSNYT